MPQSFVIFYSGIKTSMDSCSPEKEIRSQCRWAVRGLVSDSVCIDLYQKTYESQVLYPVGEKYPFYNGISIEPKSVPG